MKREEKPDLPALYANLQAAQEEYDSAHMKAQAASSVETAAVNKLSAAQKALDAAMEEIRKGAPWNTEWDNRRRHPTKAA